MDKRDRRYRDVHSQWSSHGECGRRGTRPRKGGGAAAQGRAPVCPYAAERAGAGRKLCRAWRPAEGTTANGPYRELLRLDRGWGRPRAPVEPPVERRCPVRSGRSAPREGARAVGLASTGETPRASYAWRRSHCSLVVSYRTPPCSDPSTAVMSCGGGCSPRASSRASPSPCATGGSRSSSRPRPCVCRAGLTPWPAGPARLPWRSPGPRPAGAGGNRVRPPHAGRRAADAGRTSR